MPERLRANSQSRIAYDETLAHKIIAGSDIILMPSRSEPSGLNQFYGMKYGTVPVVRATGGLDDTVAQWDAVTGTGTGFKFHGYQPDDLFHVLMQALSVFADKSNGTS